LAALVFSSVPAVSHDSPEHVVEILTARMEAVGHRPDLLWRRATEYRVLGQLDAATRDLKSAIKAQPGFLAALTDLSRIQLAQGRHRNALATINRALDSADSDAARAPLWMVRADILADRGDFDQALADCNRALLHASGNELDWYLTRSQLQCRVGRFNDAVAGLQRGFALTGSAVLEVESIDAMIEAGRFAEALKSIEPALADSRWQSSWLLRRARVRLGTGEVSPAHDDLLAALREINGRLNPAHKDYGLLVDRGVAYALLGDMKLAKRDLASARSLGADAWTLRRLELALASKR
jgi:tetratricopeptide (TPR) repeat protein